MISFKEFVESTGWLENRRDTKVPHSNLLWKDVHSLIKRRIDDWEEKEIPYDKLRATQHWVDKRWKASNKTSKNDPPRGLQDYEGNVHLITGHHRAEHAFVNKKPLKVLVYK